MTNRRKVATLLIALGAEQAAQIMAYLEPKHVQAITREIACTGKVSNQEKRAILREFRALVIEEKQGEAEGNIPPSAVGNITGRMGAQSMKHHEATRPQKVSPSYLTTLTADRAAELVSGEPEALVALLLKPLTEETAMCILQCMPAEEREGITARMKRIPAPSPAVQAQLEHALRVKAARYKFEEAIEGETALAEMLGDVDTLGIEQRQAALDAYRGAQSEQEESVTRPAAKAPVFDDLLFLPMVQLRTVLRRAETSDIQLSLLGTDMLLRKRLLRALPFTRRMAVEAKSASKANVRLGDILDAQQRLLMLAEDLLASDSVFAVRYEEPVHV